jgi:uncharacterized membrane protein
MRLHLVKNGIPFDVAFAADDDWAFAAYVAFVESEGYSVFDWDRQTWDKRQ